MEVLKFMEIGSVILFIVLGNKYFDYLLLLFMFYSFSV